MKTILTIMLGLLCVSASAQTKDPVVVSPEHTSHHVSEYNSIGEFNIRISEVHHTATIRVRLELGEICEVHPRTQLDLDVLKTELIIHNLDVLVASFGTGRPAPIVNDEWFPLHYRIGHDKLYVLEGGKSGKPYLEYVYPISNCQ